MKLDKLNWKILEELQKNARIPLKELSSIVGMSSPAVSDRISKMEEAGIIEGYGARINFVEIGFPMSVYISAKVRFGLVEKFHAIIKLTPEITECHKLTGNDCLLMRANVRNTNHLEKLNAVLSNYGELTTSLLLSSVIERKDISWDSHGPHI